MAECGGSAAERQGTTRAGERLVLPATSQAHGSETSFFPRAHPTPLPPVSPKRKKVHSKRLYIVQTDSKRNPAGLNIYWGHTLQLRSPHHLIGPDDLSLWLGCRHYTRLCRRGVCRAERDRAKIRCGRCYCPWAPECYWLGALGGRVTWGRVPLPRARTVATALHARAHHNNTSRPSPPISGAHTPRACRAERRRRSRQPTCARS